MGRGSKKPVFGLLANTSNEKATRVAREIYRKLKGNVVVENETAGVLGVKGVLLKQMKADILITVGGDGTVLRALQQNSAKILSINAGVLGFLTEIKAENFMEEFERVLMGHFIIENRIKLKTTLNSKRLFDCTNEAVLHSAQIAKMRHFRIHIDGDIATELRADGVVIATPTGSTSYALSLGGPLIDPKVMAFVIVPMAPFKLTTRPIVVPAESRIAFEVVEPKRPCLLVLDGQQSIEVSHRDRIEFTVSEKQASFVRFGGDFYRRVDEKLRF